MGVNRKRPSKSKSMLVARRRIAAFTGASISVVNSVLDLFERFGHTLDPYTQIAQRTGGDRSLIKKICIAARYTPHSLRSQGTFSEVVFSSSVSRENALKPGDSFRVIWQSPRQDYKSSARSFLRPQPAQDGMTIDGWDLGPVKNLTISWPPSGWKWTADNGPAHVSHNAQGDGYRVGPTTHEQREGTNKTKDGKGKPPIHLIPKEALFQEAQVRRFAAEHKYGPWSLEEGAPISEWVNPAIRHCLEFLDGHDLDHESRLSHLAHARAVLGIAIDQHTRALNGDSKMQALDDRRSKLNPEQKRTRWALK